MMQPSVALQNIKKRINIYHYANGAEKQTLKALLEGKYDLAEKETVKVAPEKVAPKKAVEKKVEEKQPEESTKSEGE